MTVQSVIEDKLTAALQPVFLQVENESYMHSVPENSETHFKVTLVTDSFEGVRKLVRHQQVYSLLSAELAGPVHALALHTYTPEEWRDQGLSAPASPQCMGGSKAG